MSNNNGWGFFHDHDGDRWYHHGYHHGRTINGTFRSDILTGTSRNDEIHGNGGNDFLRGGYGNDRLEGGSGYDWIDGGRGFDTAVYSGAFTDYAITLIGHRFWGHDRDVFVRDLREGRPDGIDFVKEVEALEFADFTLFLDGRNNAPYAVADVATADEGHALLVAGAVLLSNDRDVEGDELAVTGVALVSGGGSVALVGGDVVFDPGADYQYLALGESAATVLEYTVSDERGALDSVRLTVTITGENDGPEANADTATTDQDHAVTVDVLSNDTDADTSDSRTLDTAAIAAGLGSVSIVENQVEYDPDVAYRSLAADQSATVEIAYTMSDNHGASDGSTLTVTVDGVNDAPVANNDELGTPTDPFATEGAAVTAATSLLLANDTDVDDGTVLTVASVSGASSAGALVWLSPDGTEFTYDASGVADFQALAAGELATDTFTYSVSDGDGGSYDAQVTVVVQGANDDPVAEDDSAATLENVSVSGNVLTNDIDALTVLPAAFATAHGSVSIGANGDFTYIPAAHFSGSDRFDYNVTGVHGGSDTGTVSIAIEAVADAPTLTVPAGATALYAGFDSGLAPWEAAGLVSIVMSHAVASNDPDIADDGNRIVAPTEGTAMARLQSRPQSDISVQDFLGLPAGALDALNAGLGPDAGNATTGSAMRTTVALDSGQTFSFDWRLAVHDASRNDFAFFSVDDPGSAPAIAVELADGGAVGSLGNSGWQTFTYAAGQSGIHTFGLGVFNAASTAQDSFLLVDRVRVSTTGVTGDEDTAIPLAIASALVDMDGSESLSIAIAGAGGATLNHGTNLGGGNWSLTPADLEGLAITPALNDHSDLVLTVTATSTESSNGSTAATTTSFQVVVNPVSDTFDYNSIGNDPDRISGFVAGAGGDALDISDLLAGYDPATSLAADFVRLDESGGDTLVSVNADGVGDDFVPLAILQGIAGLNPDDLLTDGNLILG